MRPRHLVPVLLAFSACVTPPPRLGRSAAGYPLLLCEGMLRDKAGKPAWTLPGSYLVELLPDRSVRVVRNSALSGFPEPGALSLYAKTTVDLHLTAIDGPVIGTASAGVLLGLVSYGEEVSEVALSAPGDHDPAARVFVRTADLGTEHDKAPPPEDPPALTVFNAPMSFHAAPGGLVLDRSECTGPVELLETKDDRTTGARWFRVRVVHQVPYDKKAPRIVLSAWVSAKDFEGPSRCGPAFVFTRPEISIEKVRALMPPGFVERAPFQGEPLADGGSVHWLNGDEYCAEVRRKGDRVSWSETLRDVLYTADYGYQYAAEEAAMSLWGPNFVKRADHGRGEVIEGGGYLCGNQYLIVASSPEGLSVLHNPYLLPAPWKLLSYRPGDTETWYASDEQCAKALARRKAPESGAVGSLPRFHHGC